MRAGVLFFIFTAVFSAGLYAVLRPQAGPETSGKPAFKFMAGQKVFIVSMEVVDGPPGKLETRLDGENYERAAKAFKKEGRFDIADQPRNADFVFYCLRYGKHGEKEMGMAVMVRDLDRNITIVNEARSQTNLDGLMEASIWNSETKVHEARRFGIAVATGGVYQGRYKVIGELVKAFHKEVL